MMEGQYNFFYMDFTLSNISVLLLMQSKLDQEYLIPLIMAETEKPGKIYYAI